MAIACVIAAVVEVAVGFERGGVFITCSSFPLSPFNQIRDLVQSTLDNSKSLNRNYRLIGSGVGVPSVLHAVQQEEILGNWKLEV